MEQKNQVQEVSLRRMLFSVGYRWKSVIAAIVVFAVLIGGIQGVRTFAQVKQAQDITPRDPAAEEAYESAKEQLTRRIELLENNIADQKVYLSEALLMQLDPYHVYQAKALIYVAADTPSAGENDQQATDTSALLGVYYTIASSHEITETVAEAVGVNVLDLSELVNIYIQQNQNLQIAVYNPDAEIARQILSIYLDYLEGYRSKLSQSIAQHIYSVIFETVGLGESQSMQDKQNEARNRLTELEDALESLQEEYNALYDPAKPVDAWGAILKDGVKWAVLGAAVGAALVVAAICFDFVCADPVYSAQELKDRFGIRDLGGFWAGKRKCGLFAAKLMEAEGRVSRNSEENWDLIAANIDNFSQKGETILVAGGAKYTEEVVKLQQRLPNVKLVSVGGLMEDAAAVRMLAQCHGVILLAEKGRSRYSTISREKDRVADLKIRLVGCIIAEK